MFLLQNIGFVKFKPTLPGSQAPTPTSPHTLHPTTKALSWDLRVWHFFTSVRQGLLFPRAQHCWDAFSVKDQCGPSALEFMVVLLPFWSRSVLRSTQNSHRDCLDTSLWSLPHNDSVLAWIPSALESSASSSLGSQRAGDQFFPCLPIKMWSTWG